jgi:hypothetical protein
MASPLAVVAKFLVLFIIFDAQIITAGLAALVAKMEPFRVKMPVVVSWMRFLHGSSFFSHLLGQT